MITLEERHKRARISVDMAGERYPEHGRERMLWQILNSAWREQDHLTALVERLRTELVLYRPDPSALPPAPDIAGFWLVSVVGQWGACYAKNERHPYPVAGADLSDYNAPAHVSLCGKKTMGPWGNLTGHPPAHLVCANCRAALPVQETDR